MPAAAAADDDVSSPRPHKDRAVKRKIKSKSKSKSASTRLRRDESVSSDDSRSRRKSSKRQKRSPSRERKKRKKGKKKSRKVKVRRYSSSDSGSSCSTCRGDSDSDRSRSKSPVRKVKKVRGRSSVRDKSRRRRDRSPSCSTCSGGSRSRSPLKAVVAKNARIKVSDDERGRIHSKRSNVDDMDDTSLDRKVRMDEDVDVRLKNDRGVDNSFEEEQVLSPRVNSFEEGHVLSPKVNGGSDGFMENRFEGKNSVSDVYSMPPEDYDRYDPGESDSDSNRDRSASKNNEVVLGASSLETEDLEMILRQKALENFRKFRGGVAPRSSSIGDGKTEAKDSNRSMIDSVKSSEDKPASSLNAHSIKVGKQSISHNDVTSKLVDDQKISISSNNLNTLKVKNVHESSDNMSSEQSSLPKGSHKLIKCNPSSSIDTHRRTGTLDQSIKNVDKSISVPVVSDKDGKTTTKFHGASDNRITTDGLASKLKSSSQVSSDQSSLTKDNEEERPVAVPIHGAIPSPGANLADKAASGTSCPNSENVNCISSEALAAPKTGNQFEQKTFSRMHDGETVQVSYKVYIPKKSSTFTRRPLQR